jgi:signal transduction histidine kinase
MKNSLFLRIYLGSLLFIIVFFFLLMFILNYFFYSKNLIDYSKELQQTIELGLDNKDPKFWQNEIKIYNRLEKDHDLSLIPWESLSKEEQKKLAQSKDHRIISDNIPGQKDLHTLSKLKGSSQWILKIDERDDDGNESTTDWLNIVIPFLLLFSSLAVTLFLLIRKLTRPIKHLVETASKLGKGEWQVRANKNLPPPMNTLAQGFNNMADALNDTLQEQQTLIGAIPHELRSPLGRIRFALDMSRDKKSIRELRKDIEIIDGYVDEMQTTVDEILELNRLQNQQAVQLSELDICKLLNAQLRQHKEYTTGIEFSIDCQLAGKNISGNESLLNRAIDNLLNNAKRYAKSRIQIKAWHENNKTHIQVDDDGKGIPNDKLTTVFTPFSTLDQSRNRGTGGIGLGLSIVKIIMKKHQGDVQASRNEQGGARFELFW